MPGLPSLGEKRWAHPLPLATIPPGAWHRYTPPCLCAPWHPSHGLICHSLTLAPSTGLAHGRQLSGPGQHLSPLPFSHINWVLSIVRDIKNVIGGNMDVQVSFDFASAGIYAAQYEVAMVYWHCTASKTGRGNSFPVKKRHQMLAKVEFSNINWFSECSWQLKVLCSCKEFLQV